MVWCVFVRHPVYYGTIIPSYLLFCLLFIFKSQIKSKQFIGYQVSPQSRIFLLIIITAPKTNSYRLFEPAFSNNIQSRPLGYLRSSYLLLTVYKNITYLYIMYRIHISMYAYYAFIATLHFSNKFLLSDALIRQMLDHLS